MIGEQFRNIKQEIDEHFRDSHSGSIERSPYQLDYNRDFEENLVELHSDDFRPFCFPSRLFCSDEYCVAVITQNNYDACENFEKGFSLKRFVGAESPTSLNRKSTAEKQDYLRSILSPYFPQPVNNA